MLLMNTSFCPVPCGPCLHPCAEANYDPHPLSCLCDICIPVHIVLHMIPTIDGPCLHPFACSSQPLSF
ncbi:hypothetical protein B0O80DRAFT_285296 [Mortierella sp. GBAus27b]|nr:hypothetical protein B0O80DRAFT_285296 [Mortierella sp. GBAus27b]